jgi:alpha-glucosidase (family GH31 glycosyl hydrolase)
LINIYTKNKKIGKNIKINKDINEKFEIISFNRPPLLLKHGQILPINENVNNKRVIKLNRPLSLEEF